jgi:hypothetical protein
MKTRRHRLVRSHRQRPRSHRKLRSHRNIRSQRKKTCLKRTFRRRRSFRRRGGASTLRKGIDEVGDWFKTDIGPLEEEQVQKFNKTDKNTMAINIVSFLNNNIKVSLSDFQFYLWKHNGENYIRFKIKKSKIPATRVLSVLGHLNYNSFFTRTTVESNYDVRTVNTSLRPTGSVEQNAYRSLTINDLDFQVNDKNKNASLKKIKRMELINLYLPDLTIESKKILFNRIHAWLVQISVNSINKTIGEMREQLKNDIFFDENADAGEILINYLKKKLLLVLDIEEFIKVGASTPNDEAIANEIYIITNYGGEGGIDFLKL